MRARTAACVVAAVLAVTLAAGVGAAGTPTAWDVTDEDPASGNSPVALDVSAVSTFLQTDDPSSPCVGTITQPPDADTLVSIQGARGGDKTDAMLAGFAPDGEVIGVHNGDAIGRWWYYDVDAMPNGNLLLATTEPGISIAQEIDPVRGAVVDERVLDGVYDMHDVDLIDGDELLMVDMHDDHNRVLVRNLTRDAVVWEWRFGEHREAFPRTGGGPYGDDWTHVNDVDRIGDGVFMASVRNFDQVIAIDRETKEVVWTLGADDEHDVLYEQHNPDYLETDDGTPTVLVADSLNDRVVEYTRDGDGWERTWQLVDGSLAEPRDADRLPNGNTLVSDRRGHRVIEVTPRGEVVWEVYTPWQPYDSERVGTGPGSNGPTMRDLNVTGTFAETGSADPSTDDFEACYQYLTGRENGGPLLSSAGIDAANGSGTAGPPSDGHRDVTPTRGVIGTHDPAVDTRSAALGAILFVALVVLGGLAVHRYRRD